MNNEIRERKNFNLSTVGGAGLLLTGACSMIGIWLIATGSTLSGAIVTFAAAGMLYTAYKAFSWVRPGPPDWGAYGREE